MRGVLAAACTLLAEGARDADSPWRIMALGTTGWDGGASVRGVVLRRFEPAERLADIYTDRRSTKCAELRRQDRATLQGWDAGRRIQLRLSGTVSLHNTGDVADMAWAGLTPHARAAYAVLPGPGTRMAGPDYAMQDNDEAAARAVFAVLRLRFDRLEYLALPAVAGQGVHRRARFSWAEDAASGEWLVP